MDELIAAGQQPRVFQGNRGLVGQDLEKVQVVVIEACLARSEQYEHAGYRRFMEERRDEQRVRPDSAAPGIGHVMLEHRHGGHEGAPDMARSLAQRFPGQVDAFVVAHPRAREEQPAMDGPTKFAYARYQTRQLGEMRMRFAGSKLESATNRYVTLDEQLPKDPIAERYQGGTFCAQEYDAERVPD